MSDNKRHNYEYEVDLDGSSAPARVIRMVGAQKNVLEIGAGPGSITKHLVNIKKCSVTALEIDKDAIEKLSEYTDDIYPADLNNPDWPVQFSDKGLFDVVVAGDVLEHLYNPWGTLEKMRDLLTESGHIVVSLPHVGHSAICACLMNENFDYRDWGLLDKTHIRFFGLKNMQKMFDNAKLSISHAEFVVTRPEDTEFSEIWSNQPKDVKAALSQNQFGAVYQVVIKAIKKSSNSTSINLLSLPVEMPKANLGVKKIASQYLPQHLKSRIKRFLK